jgi:cytochrome c553
MPRLAGQQPEYLESQLQAFIDRKRTSSVMNNVAHVLSPSMVNALATHFRDLNPKPLGGATNDLVAAGKKIYDDGIPQANVPACVACHGKDAKGSKEFPRLAGQLNDYTTSKLQNWKVERIQDPAKPDNSHNLSEAQAKAVASYLSYLD